jgi:hypothetical protein
VVSTIEQVTRSRHVETSDRQHRGWDRVESRQRPEVALHTRGYDLKHLLGWPKSRIR